MTLRFIPGAGLIVVPPRLWGPHGDAVVRLALDTGATGSMVNWDVLMLLGYDPALTRERVQVTTGSGVEFVTLIAIQQVEALDLERRAFPMLCHTLPPTASVDGLLGLDYFSEHRLTIDFRVGMVTLD